MRSGRGRMVFKLRRGRSRVLEVGVADARQTRGRAKAKRFLRGYR